MIFQNYKTLFLGSLVLCVSFFVARTADAATLFLSPSETTQIVGSVVSFDVYVDTEGVNINAVSGSVQFSSQALEPLSITTEGSVIGLWVRKPAVENTTITFEGLVLSPGFSGTGKVATLRFRVLDEGQASLSFTDGLILANDGQGTNVLREFSDASLVGRAGNLTQGEQLPDLVSNVEVEDLVDRIRPPVVTQYSRTVATLDELFFQGITYPQSEVKVWLQREKDNPTERSITADGAGNFVYVHGRDGSGRDSLPARVTATALTPFVREHYYFWTSVVRDGVESEATQLFDVSVGGLWGIDASPTAILIGAIAILLILAILLLLVYIVFRGRKLFGTPPPSITRLE